jgi:hypothetical protein
VPLQAAVEDVVTDGSEKARDEGDVEGFHTIEADGVDVHGIVAIAHAAAAPWSEPFVTPADGNLMAGKVSREVGLLNAKCVDAL